MFGMMNLPDFSGNLYGYARVSTEDQNLNLQLDALRAAGIPDSRIFTEKVSGTSKKRPKLDLVRKIMREGDALCVWRLDRVGRSVVAVVEFVEGLGADGILFRCLTEPIDTTTPTGKLMLHMMAALAEFERNMIAQRTRAGMDAARSRGVKMGPPHRILDCPKRFARFVDLWADGRIPAGTMSANDVWADLNAIPSKLPQMKAQSSYSNWKARLFAGLEATLDQAISKGDEKAAMVKPLFLQWRADELKRREAAKR